MWNVNLVLVLVVIFFICYFGFLVLINMVIGVVLVVLFEYLVEKFCKKKIIVFDGSVFLIGLLLVMFVLLSLLFYMMVLGLFIVIVIVKYFMGGFGFNIFNFVYIGRVVLMVLWLVVMISWIKMIIFVDVVSSVILLNILK